MLIERLTDETSISALPPSSEPTPGVSITAYKLQKVVKKFGRKSETLLNDISLSVPSGSLVAIIGGSGTGKSTLMDALNGLRPAHKGTVIYNGQDYYRKKQSFSAQIGYVPQDDIVHRELTVERALYYAAHLRLPASLSRAEKQQRIEEVLADVEMLDRRYLMINKLSGGQRKRLSIAIELLSKPSVFFLDEPTSGLDPGLDFKLMHLLERLAHQGRTIILTTHTVSNLHQCDYLCVLARGGRLAFFGTPKEATAYFNTNNFAEVYSMLEPETGNPSHGEQVALRFKETPLYRQHIEQPVLQKVQALLNGTEQRRRQTEPLRLRRGNPLTQFFLLSSRYLELIKNDWGTLLLLLLQAPIIVVLLILLIHYALGNKVMNPAHVLECPSTASILTPAGFIDPPGFIHEKVSIDCERVAKFFKNNPQGKAFAAKNGGVNQVLKRFMAPSSGVDTQEVLFCLIFTSTMFGCINGAREIVKENAIYRRERAVNLQLLPYLASKIVILGTLCLIQSAVLVLGVNLIAPFRLSIFLPPILEVYTTVALSSFVGIMLGLTISALAPSADRAVSSVPLVLIPQIILSGTIFPFTDRITQLLAMSSPLRWAMAALGSTNGLHNETLKGDSLWKNDYTYHSLFYTDYTRHEAIRHLAHMWLVLLAFVIVFTALMIFFQKLKDYQS